MSHLEYIAIQCITSTCRISNCFYPLSGKKILVITLLWRLRPFLFIPPFPPQVQVRPVTPVTSIRQVSWSRLRIWHIFVLVFGLAFYSPSFPFFPCLALYPTPLHPHPHLIHLVLMSCHHRRRSLKWQPNNMSSLKADVNIWPNFLIGSLCLFVSLSCLCLWSR